MIDIERKQFFMEISISFLAKHPELVQIQKQQVKIELSNQNSIYVDKEKCYEEIYSYLYSSIKIFQLNGKNLTLFQNKKLTCSKQCEDQCRRSYTKNNCGYGWICQTLILNTDHEYNNRKV